MISTSRVDIHACFRAMGTEIALTGIGIAQIEMDRALALAVRLAEQWEQIFSRFRPDSELTRLNAAGGAPVVVSADLLRMLETARDAYERTGGRFDPTILPGLEAAGYDRDIDQVRARTDTAAPPAGTRPAPGMAGIAIDPERSIVALPLGVRLDLGGIAKGAFVDRLALALMTWPGGCVEAGGDLRVWGEPPDGDHWVVGIEDPEHPERDLLAAVVLDERAAAIATSAVNRRHWRIGGEIAHHLIDPATGRPATPNLLACTVVASTVVAAEAATKSLFVGAAHGKPPVVRAAAAAVLVRPGGDAVIIEAESADACRIIPLDADGQSS